VGDPKMGPGSKNGLVHYFVALSLYEFLPSNLPSALRSAYITLRWPSKTILSLVPLRIQELTPTKRTLF
jgi:hypothetical protein